MLSSSVAVVFDYSCKRRPEFLGAGQVFAVQQGANVFQHLIFDRLRHEGDLLFGFRCVHDNSFRVPYFLFHARDELRQIGSVQEDLLHTGMNGRVALDASHTRNGAQVIVYGLYF